AIEEVAGLHGGARGEVAGEELALPCAVEDVLLVGEHAAKARMSAEDFGEEYAVATADVHEALPCAEIVRGSRGGGHGPGHGGHRVVEDACQLRVATKLLKAVVVGEEFRRAFSGFERAHDLAEACEAVVAAPEDEESTERAGEVGAQEVRDVGIAEGTIGDLFEDALTGEDTQDAVERVLIDLQFQGEICS